jgi:hypothetical protein
MKTKRHPGKITSQTRFDAFYDAHLPLWLKAPSIVIGTILVMFSGVYADTYRY